MPAEIPTSHRDLLTKKTFAHLATIMKDGSPQITPVWFDTDRPYVRINSAGARLKDKSMRRQPNVVLSILDPDNSYRYLDIRGRVVEITGERAPRTSMRSPRNTWGSKSTPRTSPGLCT